MPCSLIVPRAARGIMLGYNMMAIDSDTVVLADFYAQVKQPPFSYYTMMAQSEGDKNLNGGFI